MHKDTRISSKICASQIVMIDDIRDGDDTDWNQNVTDLLNMCDNQIKSSFFDSEKSNETFCFRFETADSKLGDTHDTYDKLFSLSMDNDFDKSDDGIFISLSSSSDQVGSSIFEDIKNKLSEGRNDMP